FASARETLPLKLGSRFPNPSSADTTSPNPTPAVTLPGGPVVTTNCVAGAAATVKEVDVAGPRSLLDAWRMTHVPALSRVRPAHVATPAPAVDVVTPPSVAAAGFAAGATVTLPANVGSTLPKRSCADTTRPNPLPAITRAGGWITTTSRRAGAAAT